MNVPIIIIMIIRPVIITIAIFIIIFAEHINSWIKHGDRMRACRRQREDMRYSLFVVSNTAVASAQMEMQYLNTLNSREI